MGSRSKGLDDFGKVSMETRLALLVASQKHHDMKQLSSIPDPHGWQMLARPPREKRHSGW